jgi:hypothetical protein
MTRIDELIATSICAETPLVHLFDWQVVTEIRACDPTMNLHKAQWLAQIRLPPLFDGVIRNRWQRYGSTPVLAAKVCIYTVETETSGGGWGRSPSYTGSPGLLRPPLCSSKFGYTETEFYQIVLYWDRLQAERDKSARDNASKD